MAPGYDDTSMTGLLDAAGDHGPVALLMGAALCVGCVASLAFAAAALLGVAVIPASLGLTGPETLLITGALLGLLGGYVFYKSRKVRQAVEAGEDPDPYWSFHGPRAAVSLVAGFLAVAGVALVSKAVIEATTSATYTIHWLETVPLLSLAFAWIIHGEWNRRIMAGS